jgi:opacity protein-like surface antigen
MRIFICIFLFGGAASAQRLSAGIKAGIPVTDAFEDQTFPSPFSTGQTVHAFSTSRKFVAGGMVEVHLPLGFSVEADGLYRPLRLTIITKNAGILAQGELSRNFESWEVPVVAKYRFLHTPVIKPYAAAGVNFRILEAPLDQTMSHTGFVLGGGVEVKVSRLRISPELRYTRWGGNSNNGFPGTANRNQAELLIGVTF